jgi:hypothetical protein
MTRPQTQTSWDRYQWVGRQRGSSTRADAAIENDLEAEPRHWNEGSYIFDDGMGQVPHYLSPVGMGEGDSGFTGSGSNPGGQHWAIPQH